MNAESRRDVRRTYAILAGLVATLLLNDFVLKPTFSNFLTGKLSDFAGLAAFGLFGCQLFPRCRRLVLVASALSFAFWKSTASAGAIAIVNSVLPYDIGRVVDPWDATAAVALLPIWWIVRELPAERVPLQHAWQYGVIALSLFSFAATSETLPTDISYERSYRFEATPDSLRALLHVLPDSVRVIRETGASVILEIPWTCTFGLTAETRVSGSQTSSTLSLRNLWSHCRADDWSKAELLWLFERKVIHPLTVRLGPAVPS